MNCHRIVSLNKELVDNVLTPVIPEAVGSDLSVSKNKDFWLVYGEPVDRVGRPIAILLECITGQFVVFANDESTLDSFGNGTELKDYSDKRNWPWYRVNGDLPDNPEDANPGDRISISNRVVKMKARVPSNAANSKNPWTLDGDIKAVKAWPSIPSTIGGIDLIGIIESGLPEKE